MTTTEKKAGKVEEFNYTAEKKKAVLELCEILAKLGYDAYIAESGAYGFFTPKDGSRVVSFQVNFSWFDFSINHKSVNLGTGYRITNDGECPIYNLSFMTAEYAQKLINSPSYRSRKKSERFISWTTKQQHIDIYGSSSKYVIYTPSTI